MCTFCLFRPIKKRSFNLLCVLDHQKGVKHEFQAAHKDSLLYFYCQEYCTILAKTKCLHWLYAKLIIVSAYGVCFVCIL